MKAELEKVIYNTKTYVAFIGVLMLPILFFLASETGFRMNMASSVVDTPEDDGWQLIINSMNLAMHFFAPLICAMIASDTIAGEASNGMLTLSLSKPISRRDYLFKKIIVQAVVVLALFTVFALVSLLAGLIMGYNKFYGVSESGLPSIKTNVPANEIWWRMLMFFFFGAVGGFVVILVTIAVSTYSNSVSTVTTITFVFYMLTEIGGGMIEGSDYQEYLLAPAIKKLIWSQLYQTIAWGSVLKSFIILLVYASTALTLAVNRFSRKDIT